MIEGLAALKAMADRRIEGVVCRVAAGEQRVAAVARDLHRIQQRAVVRQLGVDHVMMEIHFAVGQRPDDFAVLPDVGDQHDVGKQFRVALGKIFRRPRQRSNLAEISGRSDQILLGKSLAAKHQNQVIEPSLVDVLDSFRAKCVAQVDTADFGTNVLCERNDLQSGPCRCVHRFLHGGVRRPGSVAMPP